MCVCVCVFLCVCAQLCPILCDLVDCSLPGTSVRRVVQARILERVAIYYSRGSSRPRDQTCVSLIPCIGRRIFFTVDLPGKPTFFISINKFISAFLGLTDSINLQSLNCSINQFHHLTGLSWIKLKNIWHVVLLYLYESRKCCNLTCGWYCIMIWRVLCRAEFSWKPRAADLRYRRATPLSEVLCHWSWILM